MSNFVEKKNIFQGMTMAQMKDTYSKMTAKERGEFAGAFVRAAKTAKKPTTQRQQAPKGQQAPKAQKTRATKPKPNAKAKSESAKIASAMKSEVNTRKSQKVTDAMKRDVNKRAESRSGTRKAAQQTESKTEQRRRGSGVKKTGKKVNLGKTLQNLSDKFKLTRKAGEVFTVGNMRYVSDGKGGIRSSQRIR